MLTGPRIQIRVPLSAGRGADPRLSTALSELKERSEQMLTLIERMQATSAPVTLKFYAAYYRDALRRLAGINPRDSDAETTIHTIANEIRQVQRTLLDACLTPRSNIAFGKRAIPGVYH